MLKLNHAKSAQLGLFAILAAVLSLLSAAPVLEAADVLTRVDSKEYKLLLRVEQFADRTKGVNQFWSGVLGVAEQIQLPVSGSMTKLKERRVRFLDTKDFCLWKKYHFIFRERIDLESDGTEEKRKKVTLKYRAEDIDAAAAIDVSSTTGKKREEKLEEDISPPRVSKFSKSGSTEIKTKKKLKKVSDMADAFPVLKELPIQDKKVLTVNGFQAHEIKIEGVEVTLNGEHKAEASFSFWYDQKADGSLLAAEFSFDYEVGPGVAATVDQRADCFFAAIQNKLNEWIDKNAKTKTHIAYNYKK